MQAAELFEQDMKPLEVARRLRVSRRRSTAHGRHTRAGNRADTVPDNSGQGAEVPRRSEAARAPATGRG